VVEQRYRKPLVDGSIPSIGSSFCSAGQFYACVRLALQVEPEFAERAPPKKKAISSGLKEHDNGRY
jgi:hypothetical protein